MAVGLEASEPEGAELGWGWPGATLPWGALHVGAGRLVPVSVRRAWDGASAPAELNSPSRGGGN